MRGCVAPLRWDLWREEMEETPSLSRTRGTSVRRVRFGAMTRRRDRAFGAWLSSAGGPAPIAAADGELRVLDAGRGATGPDATCRGATSPGVTSAGVTNSGVTSSGATGRGTTRWGATGGRSVWALMRARRSRWALRWAALGSVALHAGVLAAFLILADRAARGVHEAIDAAPMIELVMVQQKGQDRTAAQAPPLPDRAAKTTPSAPSAAPPPIPPPAPRNPPAPAASNPPPPAPPPSAAAADAVALPPPPPPAPPAAASPAATPPPRPQVAAREAPPRPPSPAQAPAPQAAPAAPTPPAPVADPTPRVNLGGTGDLSNVLVKGDNVIPAGPDPKVHNREPVYPFESVRRGQQGMVGLLVHVSPEGLPSQVAIEHSSGFDLLDRAARDAVASWRFVPAVRDGQPIPSNASVRIVFQLD